MEAFGSGHSGFTYAVDAGEQRLILRLSPPGVRIAGPSDIGRQGRIMSALHASGMAVPRILACSSDPEIDGRSFALMECVPGTGWEEAFAEIGGLGVTRAAVDTLRALATVPLADTGIGDEAAVEPAGEIERWQWLLRKAPEPMRRQGALLDARLRECMLEAQRPALVHGDYHYANLLFEHGAVSAVVDWEIAEIGQPLLDLGSLVVTAMRIRYAPDPNPSGNLGLTPSEVVALYGAPPELAAWYTALSCFKYGAIFGYNLQLHLSGKRPDDVYESLRTTMAGLLDDGLLILEGGLEAVDRP